MTTTKEIVNKTLEYMKSKGFEVLNGDVLRNQSIDPINNPNDYKIKEGISKLVRGSDRNMIATFYSETKRRNIFFIHTLRTQFMLGGTRLLIQSYELNTENNQEPHLFDVRSMEVHKFGSREKEGLKYELFKEYTKQKIWRR